MRRIELAAGEEEPTARQANEAVLAQAIRALAELFQLAPDYGRIAVEIEFRGGRASLVEKQVSQTMRPA